MGFFFSLSYFVLLDNIGFRKSFVVDTPGLHQFESVQIRSPEIKKGKV
jgi:hypothetical protein